MASRNRYKPALLKALAFRSGLAAIALLATASVAAGQPDRVTADNTARLSTSVNPPTPGPTGNVTTTRVFRPSNGAIFVKSQHTTGFADAQIAFGLPGDRPVAGDWTGKGFKSIGVYRDATFYLRNSNTTGFADIAVSFGLPGDLAVVGDWNGDGVDTIGVYRNGTFYLRNSNTPGPPDLVVTLGVPGDVPIAGDWTRKGFASVGVFRPSNGAVFLRNSNVTGFADIELAYGLPGDKPVVGDWNGDGTDTIGVYRNGQFLLRNSNTLGFAEITFALGVAGDEPIAGNWGTLPSAAAPSTAGVAAAAPGTATPVVAPTRTPSPTPGAAPTVAPATAPTATGTAAARTAAVSPAVPGSGPTAPPDDRPGWRWTSEGLWVNDLSGQTHRPGDPIRPIPPPGAYRYTASFDNGPAGWESIVSRAGREPFVDIQWRPSGGKSGGYLLSEGPWWLDTNQGAPGGTGNLHLVAYTWARNLLDNADYHNIDFRNAVVSTSLRGESVNLLGSHLVFWVQARRGEKFVNYALTGQPLDAALVSGAWTDIVLRLTEDPSQWTCLGASTATADRYGCAPLGEVLADVNRDFGFLLFPVESLPTGKIGIDELSIQYQLRPRASAGPGAPPAKLR